MSRMFERIESGELAVGTIFLAHGAEWMEIAGHVGLDFACIDMMFNSIDWKDAADMIRAANIYQMTPWIRLQAYPWVGQSDPRILPDVARAFSIGAEVVTISLDTPEQIVEVLKLRRDWHRKPYLTNLEADSPNLSNLLDRIERRTLIIPLLESLGAVQKLDEIMSIDGLRAVWLGMGDLSRQLGHPGELDHPDVRAVVRDAAQLGSKHGVMVVCNPTSRRSGNKAETILADVQWMWEHGVRIVHIPYFELVIHDRYQEIMQLLRNDQILQDKTRDNSGSAPPELVR